jgi:hypothetical protein
MAAFRYPCKLLVYYVMGLICLLATKDKADI